MTPNINHFMEWRLPISVSCFFLVPTFRRKLGKKLAATSTSCRQKFSFSEAAFLLSVLIRGSGCYECKDGINQHLSNLWSLTCQVERSGSLVQGVLVEMGSIPDQLGKIENNNPFGLWSELWNRDIVKSVCMIKLIYHIWVLIRSSNWMYYLVFIARILLWKHNAYWTASGVQR